MKRRILMAAALAALTATAALRAQTASAVQTQATQAEMTPAKAIALLKEGNARFAGGKSTAWNYPAQVHATGGRAVPLRGDRQLHGFARARGDRV